MDKKGLEVILRNSPIWFNPLFNPDFIRPQLSGLFLYSFLEKFPYITFPCSCIFYFRCNLDSSNKSSIYSLIFIVKFTVTRMQGALEAEVKSHCMCSSDKAATLRSRTVLNSYSLSI